jgi:hypothetical protein
MEKKVKIHQFDPEIFPFKLWIAITTNTEVLPERFIGIKYRGNIFDNSLDGREAVTFYVEEKSSTYKGVLIVFSNKQYCTVKTIAHEATHAARFLWDHLGESPTGEEADAYLVGWIAKCIEIVKNFKQDYIEPTDR